MPDAMLDKYVRALWLEEHIPVTNPGPKTYISSVKNCTFASRFSHLPDECQ